MKIILSRRRPDISTDAKDYLVVENKNDPATWHLPVYRNGKLNRRLMGAAYAALTSNHRGNAYLGPGKERALSKLLALYKKIGQNR